MALVPALTPVEQMLLNGPRALSAYPGESFGWMATLLSDRFCDWNTALATVESFGVERLQALCDLFEELVLGPLPGVPISAADAGNAEYVDRHKQGRRAVVMLRGLASMVNVSRVVRYEAHQAAMTSIAESLDKSGNRADRRTNWEWTAWLGAMETNLLQTKSALRNAQAMSARKRHAEEASVVEREPKRDGSAVHSAEAAQ